MPRDSRELPIDDPFAHSIQWSRRFIGLKFYLTLLMFGWDGLAQMFRRKLMLGNKLKVLLERNNWKVVNDAPLPIVCFTNPRMEDDKTFIEAICQDVVRSGKAWISVYNIGEQSTLRPV